MYVALAKIAGNVFVRGVDAGKRLLGITDSYLYRDVIDELISIYTTTTRTTMTMMGIQYLLIHNIYTYELVATE